MFFGGGYNRSMYRGRQHPPHQRQRGGGGPHAETPRTGAMQILQFIPLLVIFVLSFFSMDEGPAILPFSLRQTVEHPVGRETRSRSVHSGIPYFVGRDFHRRHGRDWRALTRVEQLVESHYVQQLEGECKEERRLQGSRVQRARQLQDEEAMREALAVKLEACERLGKLV
jgi:hypothetical protein